MKLMSHLKVLCSKMMLTVRDRVSTIFLADSICGISTIFLSCFRRWYLQQQHEHPEDDQDSVFCQVARATICSQCWPGQHDHAAMRCGTSLLSPRKSLCRAPEFVPA